MTDVSVRLVRRLLSSHLSSTTRIAMERCAAETSGVDDGVGEIMAALKRLGLGDKMPQEPPSPGRDFSPVLAGKSIEWENVMFYEFEILRAVRAERWKYIARHPGGPHELYDMKNDPHERVNLYGQPGMEAIRDEMAEKLTAFFDQYADPQYDISKGGRSKARRFTDRR